MWDVVSAGLGGGFAAAALVGVETRTQNHCEVLNSWPHTQSALAAYLRGHLRLSRSGARLRL